MGSANDTLLQYGAVGVIAVIALLAVKVLFSRWGVELERNNARLSAELEGQRQRGDRLELELIKLNETVRNEYLSTISRSVQATAEATRAVTDALAAVRRG